LPINRGCPNLNASATKPKLPRTVQTEIFDAIQFKDEYFEETVATIHEGIRHLVKLAGQNAMKWKSTDAFLPQNLRSMVFRFKRVFL
jgi:hypothetical protein